MLISLTLIERERERETKENKITTKSGRKATEKIESKERKKEKMMVGVFECALQ